MSEKKDEIFVCQCIFGIGLAILLYILVYALANLTYKTTGRSNVILKTNPINLRQRTPRINRFKKMVRPILTDEDYNRINVFDMKNHHIGTGVGYTLNKRDIFICTVKEDGTPEDDDVIMFVLLHELAHAICKRSIHHDATFLQTFDTVLRKARNAGIPYREEKRICGTCLRKDGGVCIRK